MRFRVPERYSLEEFVGGMLPAILQCSGVPDGYVLAVIPEPDGVYRVRVWVRVEG